MGIYTLSEIQPPEAEKKLEPNDLKKLDEEKRQTGKQPERILAEANLSFQTVFGLQPEMKALKSLTAPEGLTSSDDLHRFDQICMEMAELRFTILKKNPSQRSTVSQQVLQSTLEKYYPDITPPDPDFVQSYTPDKILDVGSPYAKLAGLFGSRVVTIDYEFEENTQNEGIRSRVDVAHNFFDQNISATCRQLLKNPATPEALRPILDGTGHTYEDDGETVKVRGIAQVIESMDRTAKRFADGVIGTGVAEFKMNFYANELRNLRAQAALITDLAQSPSPFRDPRFKGNEEQSYDEFTYQQDLSDVMRDMYYPIKAVEQLELYKVYEKEVLPKVLYEQIEEIMEVVFGGDFEKLSLEARDNIHRAIKALGMDPETYSPTSPGARPFDVIKNLVELPNSQFGYEKGLNKLASMDDGENGIGRLAEQMNQEITREMERINPINPNMVEEAPVHKLLFPHTQELAGGYDRVLMCWSFSPRMLPQMPDKQIVEEVWTELDRLLANGGTAVIFPIGHYDNDTIAVERGISTEQRLEDTLKRYNERAGKKVLSWKIWDSPDRMMENSSILVITKGDQLPEEIQIREKHWQ